MITKRSKFWTIVFAFLPGAGHMYNGFMKLGVSFMGLFFGLWMIASVINLGPITLLAPVIWFYAFFDCINKIYQDDDEFYLQEDRYLFTREQLEKLNIGLLKEKNLLIGVILIIIGIYTLWNNVVLHMISVYGLLTEEAYQALVNLGNILPQLAVGGLIIWAGFALVRGKKEEIAIGTNDDNGIKPEVNEIEREEGAADDGGK